MTIDNKNNKVPKLEKAELKAVKGSTKVTVHFNPESLQYSIQNNMKEEGSGAKKKQYVTQTTAKLTMQLVFDTTDTGEDVRSITEEIGKLLKAEGKGDKKTPSQVEFGWGTYRFTGIIEQFKETIDFFAPGGVPLRSTVDLTLASQDVVFDSARNPKASVDGEMNTTEPRMVSNGSPSGVAGSAGDPRSARAIAAFNGSSSLRFSAGAELAVGGGVTLQSAAAFSVGASAGAGFGIGGGIGVGGGIGIGAGAGADLSVGGGFSAGAGASIGGSFSAGASAGVSGGAFADLRSTTTTVSMPNTSAIFEASASVSTGAGTQFAAGGRAQSSASASLSADVGTGAELQSRISFG